MSEGPAPITPRRLDRGFRWRGEADVSRLESFTDGVFAIVLALVFLRSEPPLSFADLGAAMRSMVPALPAFAILCYLWFEHWLFSRRFNLRDGWTAFLNLALLFLVLVYAYPLKTLFTWMYVFMVGPIGELTPEVVQEGFRDFGGTTWLFTYYSSGYLLIFLVYVLLYRHAWKERAAMQLNAFEEYELRASLVRFWFQILVAAASITFALTRVWEKSGLPGWCYMVLGPGMGVLGWMQGRRGAAIYRETYGDPVDPDGSASGSAAT